MKRLEPLIDKTFDGTPNAESSILLSNGPGEFEAKYAVEGGECAVFLQDFNSALIVCTSEGKSVQLVVSRDQLDDLTEIMGLLQDRLRAERVATEADEGQQPDSP